MWMAWTAAHKINQLPVAEDGQLAGMISDKNITRSIMLKNFKVF